MKECSKSIARRLQDSLFVRRYFVGHGLDLGGKPDPLALYAELFPLMRSVKTWDKEEGDAELLETVQDESVDFVHSSHCLEHLAEPRRGLAHWMRVLRPGGFLIVTVPDEDLYEQGHFPSTFNKDHKWTFTIHKCASWSTRSINVTELLAGLGQQAEIERIMLLNAGYRYHLPRYDQTLTPVAECGIEFIVRKRPLSEQESGGRRPPQDAVMGNEETVHFNQYRNDLETLKAANSDTPPFTDNRDISRA
ncbi:methyltransferase domain-containing protein [Fundidesulfovibrio soli]|uniref:methyltransferase domain-containing protein n=1 Tax=Fundidesulfovibrio soli TaxID=2922716 RepID=UPI001FB00F10|nr:class I SAM-dependent methyltransferase [Fundidesulfovibrio soli]